MFLPAFYFATAVSLVTVVDSIVFGCIPTLGSTPVLAIVLFLLDHDRESFMRFSRHYARILRLFRLNVQFLRLLSLVFAQLLIFALISSFSLIFPPCPGLSGVSVHFITTSSLSFVETVTFRDFDSNISSVCVHIFPRRTLAYQVSTLLCVSMRKRGINGLALAFCIVFSSCFLSFLPFYDVIF